MPDEIERKYLVTSAGWREAVSRTMAMDQAYLAVDPSCTVRVRIVGEEAFLTIKGRKVGASAPEFEYGIPKADAKEMMERLPIAGRVSKLRHIVSHAGLRWEVDEFQGENAGLIVAEVELQSESQAVELPDWVGEEVTADRRYANSSLAQKPFKEWRVVRFA